MTPSEPTAPPASEIHVWQADLNRGGWPPREWLPATERDRAAAIVRPESRRRWVASRWALRGVLCRYLARPPAEIELRCGEHGKPALAESMPALRFNLSHSGELALIAVGVGREIGVDVERVGARPVEFYVEWTRREAVAKCLGTGLGTPLPEAATAVLDFDAGPDFIAAIAAAGDAVPQLRRFSAEPAGLGF